MDFQTTEQTQLTKLKKDLLQKAVRYARIRTDWFFIDSEERKAIDPVRTAAHDASIDACNILSRNTGKQGESWNQTLSQAFADFENIRPKCSINTEAKKDCNAEQLSGKFKFC